MRVEVPGLSRRALWASLLLAAALAYAAGGAVGRPATAPAHPAPAAWPATGLHVAALGHATVLVSLDGTNLLFDPALFDRIGLEIGPVTIGPKRLVAAALSPDELPRLDAVVLSHAHMDHTDRRSLEVLAATTPLLVTAERTRDIVDDTGFARVAELAWGERIEVGGAVIEAFRVNHWGRRWPWDGWRGYNGYLVTKGDLAVVFASDTAYGDFLKEIGARQRLDALIIGIGAYDPWIWNHVSPEQAWQMFGESGARVLVPVHYDVFRLGKEPIGEAMTRLLAAAGPQSGRIVAARSGEEWSAPPAKRVLAASDAAVRMAKD